ncbi:unnamed protein product [Chironomus riparius]|uniref:Uncharacterized protein n=1 Tax=Chironomus riparius TaxID=315576 RepID=A0A9N9WTE3_9DIPT|nr:unnamed protein product [Chironomus riparius]
MKFLSTIFFVAAVFVAGSNGGSPSLSLGISSSPMFIGSSSGSFVASSSSSSMAGSSSAIVMSSSSDQGVCYVVAHVIYEFNAFTSNILKLYILNFQRSDDSSTMNKSEKLTRMVEEVESHEEVPDNDKVNLRNLCEGGDKGRAFDDEFTHDNIWDCFVGIFTGALSGVLAP